MSLQRIALVLATLPLSSAPLLAQTTTRASLGLTGVEGNNISYSPRISDDGRFVVFETQATNLIPGDSNLNKDVLVRDLVLGTTAVISINTAGVQGSAGAGSHAPDISADGRYVVFHSYAGNFGSDANGIADIFLRDRDPDSDGIYDEPGSTTELVTFDLGGFPSNGGSQSPRISDDATLVAFDSAASDLVPAGGIGGAEFAVFARDLAVGMNELVSVDLFGLPAMGRVQDISADGRYVLFWSNDPDLVPGDTNGVSDVFVRDLSTTSTVRVSVASGGGEGNLASSNSRMSADGRFVAFYTRATNLVSGGTANLIGIYLRDRDPDTDGIYDESNATTEMISINSFEVETAGAIEPIYAPSVSDDGRFVAFSAGDSSGSCCDLVIQDANGNYDIFLRDRLRGETTRLSVDGEGIAMSGKSWGPDLTPEGLTLVYSTWSALVSDDLNTHEDIYVRDSTTWRDLSWNMLGSLPDPLSGVLKSVPVLSGDGTLAAAVSNTLTLAQANKGSFSYLVVGSAELSIPLLGGLLVPAPVLIKGKFISSPATSWGGWTLDFTLSPGLPPGSQLLFQAWVLDPAGPSGVVSSNALRAVAP